MIKNKNKLLIIFIFIGILFLVKPSDTFAQYKSNKAVNTCKTHKASWDDACEEKYGINITATDYQRTTGIGINNVADRTITITAKKDTKYRIRILYGDIDTVDNLNFESLSDLDAEVADSDDNLKLKKVTMTDGKFEWTLKEGKEALVLVILSGADGNDRDSGETCTTGTGKNKQTHPVLCKAGQAEQEAGEVNLKGVAASLFVENPKDSGLVKNIRWRYNDEFGKACKNAAEGIYANSKNEEDKNNSAYTKEAQNNKAAWGSMYDSVLGNYCNSEYFAFNLKESQIRKISNQLLELFYYNSKLENAKNDPNILSLESVNTKIENIKSQLTSERIFTKDEKREINNLACRKDAVEKESTDYLYDSELKTIKTEELSNGKQYKVCDIRCYEHLTVTYDPPVASIAGLCFTYKVTVQSETECGMKQYDDYKAALVNKNACSPVPICSNDDSHTQAGPSEDFDECIKKCDDGKYSQKCINKCYSEVYERKENTDDYEEDNDNLVKNTENKNVKKYANEIIDNLSQTSSDYRIARMAFDITDENDLKEYYKEDNYKKCNTDNLKKYFGENPNTEMQTECAKYFFFAKSLYPYGHYNSTGTKWISNSEISSAGATDKDVSNIPMQIARSSPFYLRDEGSTKDLLKSLVGYYDSNNIWKKYNIKYGANGTKANGVKRQYSNRYVCNEVCSYTGCNEGDALSSKKYVDNTKDDLEKISEAVKKCSVTDACNKEVTESVFTINILNPRKNENEEDKKKTKEATGTTILGKIEPNSEEKIICPDEGDSEENADLDDRFSMFVPANDDKNSKYGILGYCYDKNSAYPTLNPQYKTTITFPGSWINYKARKIEYNKKDCNSGWELKGGYFCSAYDSEDVNEEWWKWRMQMKDKAGNIIYSTVQEPENNNNIRATANNFGKYNWNITYSCFYGIHSEPPIPGDDDDDDGGTRLQDHKFQVFKAGDLFTEDSNQKQGYNWTSDATVTAGVNVNDARALTYTINPQKYINYINKYEKDEKIYDSEEDYYIYLSSDGMKYIKNYRGEDKKQLSYTDYNGEFKEDPNINGLVRYTSSLLIKLNGYGNKDIYIEKANGIEKINNNYNDLNSLLGID